MAATDPVSSISGRNSRASNVSGITAASRSVRAHRPPKDTLASAGVLSMLKTTTDTGDIGSLSFNSSRLPAMPRATHQKRGHHPRPSGSKIHYATSQVSGVSSSRDWETVSNPRRGSLTSMQSMPPSLPPVHLGKDAMHMPPPLVDAAGGLRSYSLTSAPPTSQLPRHRSATSLKNQDYETRQVPPLCRPRPPPPPMAESRPPYVYPARLRRPGYRSPSPALSDSYAHPTQLPSAPPGSRRGPVPASSRSVRVQPPMQEYGVDCPGDPRHLNIRPPPRAMSNSPVMGYNEPTPYHLPYRNPAAVRSAPGLSVPMPAHGEQHFHMHRATGPPQTRRPPPPLPPPIHSYGHASMVSHPPYAAQPYLPRSGYPHGQQTQHVAYRPAQPPTSVNPMAHQMFHNAARMARQLPQRTDTPMTDLGPPPSDPPSSGTAPTSSSPATPKDYSTIQVAVDPAFIDPALADLQDSSSEPVLAHQYLRYADGLEKDVDDTEIEVLHPSVPPSGFVQRVKAMLESKAAAEAAMQTEFEREKVSPVPPAQDDIALIEYHGGYDEVIHELAANETPRFTVIEEFEAPIELPASPVRLPELPGSEVSQSRRITRDLVKAELAPSSVDNTTTQAESGDSKNIDELVNSRPRRSCDTGKYTSSTNDGATDGSQSAGKEPSTPAQVVVVNAEDTSSEITSSPVALGFSGIEYATRLDTTDETQSRDPFVLDADTITMRQHGDKARSDKRDQATISRQISSMTSNDEPVSPIQPGEDVSRCSAVSPLHTQTLGIDETLRAASECVVEGSSEETSEEHTELGAFPKDSHPPNSPRASKAYSKSVQLQPSSTFGGNGTPPSNRFSLPPDLSTFSETTVNDSTDMITDIAVRFSLPQTIATTVSKPQIIEIPPSSSPVRELSIRQPPNAFMHAPTSNSKRGSVTFADEVAPLKINRKPGPSTEVPKRVEVRASVSKSIVRRMPPFQELSGSSWKPCDTMANVRFSGINDITNTVGSTHLPGLKEESIEEMSISDKHKSDGTTGMQFPLPARIAAVKAMQERRLQETAEKAKARRANQHPNRPLAETRDLPSLNFSRMDLIDKLNEALEVRSSKSMELIRRREFSAIYCPAPQRPQSTEPLRERYMSFFSKPEDFSSLFGELAETNEGDTEDEAEIDHDAVVSEAATEGDSTQLDDRPLSPEDFLNFANQINRLSIPSVTGLSDRLSEILPNLRDLQLDSVLAGFSEASYGNAVSKEGARPGTVLSTRTSAGFRTLAERAEEIVKNGTHDSTVPIAQVLAGVKELPALPAATCNDDICSVNSQDGKHSYLSGSKSAPTALGKDVARPASVSTRQKSPSNEEEVQALLPPEMNPITRHGRRALVVSSSSSRPWNQDENYPWAETKLDVDLTVPLKAHARSSTASEIIRDRKAKSLELIGPGDLTNDSNGIDIGSIYEQNPTASVTSEQLTGYSPQNHRKPSKRSVIGSLTKKLGIGSRYDSNATRSIPTPSDVGRSGSTIPHCPGERYPTSGLTPPAAFNLDEVRSFFSDDSSDKGHNASFRKRLTKLKSKKSLRLDLARSHSRHTMDDDTAYDAGQMSVERAGAMSSSLTIDGVGMGKTEFRIKRFGEKLRYLMAKGGELIRSLSQRSKAGRAHTERVRDDWLSDSLYSGV